jgi:hypothetical protein
LESVPDAAQAWGIASIVKAAAAAAKNLRIGEALLV